MIGSGTNAGGGIALGAGMGAVDDGWGISTGVGAVDEGVATVEEGGETSIGVDVGADPCVCPLE